MLRKIASAVRRFRADQSGSAGSEFVVSLPLLLGVMVIASEYGGALQVRDALDAATNDAARFLGRAPLDSSGDLRPYFITEAHGLVAERLGVTPDRVNFEAEIDVPSGTEDAFRAEYRVITVDVSLTVRMPLLALLDIYSGVDENSIPAIEMYASETAPWVGEVPPDETAACNWVMQLNGEC